MTAAKVGWKLFRLRKDGSLGPLFINCRQRLQVGVAYTAEAHRTPGYAFRPGWHVCSEMNAPHLSKRNRVWCRVEISGKIDEHQRPASQGGLWFTAEKMRILEIVGATDQT